MEKRCIQFIWNLMNSDTSLFNITVKHSLSMSSTTLAEQYNMLCSNMVLYERMVRTFECVYGKIQKHINETYFVNK